MEKACMKKMRILFCAACLVIGSNQVFATGNDILTKGPDTLLVAAQTWAEAHDRVKPDITISVGGGGSGAGFDALLKGLVIMANSSRPIDTFELERASRGENSLRHRLQRTRLRNINGQDGVCLEG